MTTQKAKFYVSDFHFDHKLWMNELNFFEMQMDVFEERLEDVVRKTKSKEAMAELEAFQNKIIRQREVIDELKHRFRLRDRDLDAYESDFEVPTNTQIFDNHRNDRAEMQTFIRLYQEMRQSYMAFLENYTA